jgi:hypothetical protein
VMDRLLLLLLLTEWAAVDDDDDDEEECSVICGFGRLEYDEWRDGDDVAEAGDEGRNMAAIKGS